MSTDAPAEQRDLSAALDAWRGFRVAVIGDVMLDELQYGNAERLTADAPVPVLHVQRTESRPGGAANVCRNIVALGGEVRVVAVVGDDEAGRTLVSGTGSEGIDTDGLIRDESRPTTVKRSLIGLAQHRHPQKMFRVDFESTHAVSGEVLERVLREVDRAVDWADVVCIEDYNKGLCSREICSRAIDRSREAGKPVLVDPASIDDYARYSGATCVTPNRTEAEKATGLRSADCEPETMARRLADEHGFDSVVLTLDREGALLLERGGEPAVVPTRAREVYDVTGAGDMVLAGLAAAIGNGCGMTDAVRFANAAAGLEVEIFGVQPIPFERVRRELVAETSGAVAKLWKEQGLLAEIERRREAGQRVVFTNGCFDVLHAGHVTLLDKAADEGDFLVVAINSDESTRRYKGPTRPINGELDRARVLSGLEAVGAVVIYEDDTPVRLIRMYRPDVLAKGGEYSEDRIPGASYVKSIGGRVVQIPMVPGLSSTGLLDKSGHKGASIATTKEHREQFVRDNS